MKDFHFESKEGSEFLNSIGYMNDTVFNITELPAYGFWVYELWSSSGIYYIGKTKNPVERMLSHRHRRSNQKIHGCKDEEIHLWQYPDGYTADLEEKIRIYACRNIDGLMNKRILRHQEIHLIHSLLARVRHLEGRIRIATDQKVIPWSAPWREGEQSET